MGTIAGGESIKAIARKVALKLDVLAAEETFLAEFDAWLFQSGERNAGDAPGRISVLGQRPFGTLATGHFLVEIVRETHGKLGLSLSGYQLSTNANALLAAGIPSLTTGLAEGATIHTGQEYLHLDSLEPGYRKLGALAARLEQMASAQTGNHPVTRRQGIIDILS